MKKNKLVKPFLKRAWWKRQLLPQIRKLLPKKITNYYEPFIGGGAVLFDIQPKAYTLNDINGDLVNVYTVVKNNVDSLITELKTYKNESSFFYSMRELDRQEDFEKLSDLKKAARLIYLNKTCFNGLFRVNSQWQFNVPFGNYKNPDFVNEVTLKAVSNYLNESTATFLNLDFEEVLKKTKNNSFVYLDPPYDPVSDSASFTGYTMDGFWKEDQERLKAACDDLNKRGCKFLLSNSSTNFVKNLYTNYNQVLVKANRNINSVASKRWKIDELLITNYE